MNAAPIAEWPFGAIVRQDGICQGDGAAIVEDAAAPLEHGAIAVSDVASDDALALDNQGADRAVPETATFLAREVVLHGRVGDGDNALTAGV